MTEPQAALLADQVSKRYSRGAWALREASVWVEPGSRTALVGPNAAGKSTLFRLWMGFERPTSGKLSILGFDPVREPERALGQVGFVPQATSLYRDLSVEEHVALAHQLRSRVDVVLARQRLDKLAVPWKARAGRLSGGQQAQVSLAIALASRPDVLLLDEPLASLDPLARSEFIGTLLTDVAERGATVLLSSHSVADVQKACDRIIVLGIGRVLAAGSIQSLIREHRVQPGDRDGAPDGSQRIASFATDDGRSSVLLRIEPDSTADLSDLPVASLDEIVRGYLTAGRETTSSGLAT